jgi:hyperosmotically inducible periplasmic protein
MNTALATTLVLTLTIAAGCDSRQDDGRTVGQQVDKAVEATRNAAAEVQANAARGLDQAANAAQETSKELARRADDAAITAAINAQLAKDPELAALDIDVDTREGRVSLQGVTPSDAARQRAQAIAQKEKGVTAVDNQLSVQVRQK